MTTQEWWVHFFTLIVHFFTLIVGAIGFWLAFRQYQATQQWQRSECAAKLLDRLLRDDELVLTCKLLDWRKRSFQVPEKYRLIAATQTFEHDWDDMVVAMSPEPPGGSYSWQQAMYRDQIEALCEYLQLLNHLVSIQLIELESVSTVKYWLRELAEPRFAPAQHQRMFISFIKRFDYHGVLQLMQRFSIAVDGRTEHLGTSTP